MGEKLAGPEDGCDRGAMTPRRKKQINTVNAYYAYKWKQLTTAALVFIALSVVFGIFSTIYGVHSVAELSRELSAVTTDPPADIDWIVARVVIFKWLGSMVLLTLGVTTPITVFLLRTGTRKYMARWATLTPEEQLLYIDWMHRADRAHRAARA